MHKEDTVFENLKGKKVTIFLNCSSWSEYRVTGEVTGADDTWMHLKRKNDEDIVRISEIKRILIQNSR